MGFFDLKANCSICNKEIGWYRYQIANKQWICPDCLKKCGNSATITRRMTVSDINVAMSVHKTNIEELSLFNATKRVGKFIEFDDKQMKWLVPDGIFGKNKSPKIYKYSDIVDFELLEDGESITKGGLGRAVAGGVLFGGIGAVVGGVTGGKKNKAICNSLKIKITINNINKPTVYINFLTASIKKNSFTYKTLYNSAQECLSVLQLICNGQEVVENNNIAITSNADEILKFKNLLDGGVITQEEFEGKKKQLLDL